MATEYKQTFITELRRQMAVTASILLSPILKRVIKVFSLAQTIIKRKYYIEIYGSMIIFVHMIHTERIYTKSLILQNNKICFFSFYHT